MTEKTPESDDEVGACSARVQARVAPAFPMLRALLADLGESHLMPQVMKSWLADRRASLGGHRASFWTAVFDGFLLVFLGVFLLGIIVNLFEPFGLGNATKAHSQRISARFFAPFYDSAAQDHVAVVLIDDATLQARGMEWPPRYSYYDELLRRILAQQPSAVYVDVLLLGRRDYDDSFDSAYEGLSASLLDSGVPVYFGVDAPGRHSIFAGTGVRDVVTSWQGSGATYPLHIGVDMEMQPAGIAAANSRAERAAGADRRSVTLALYGHACAEAGMPGCSEAADALGAHEGLPPMAVQWGSSLPVVPPGMAGQLRHCVSAARPDSWSRLGRSLALVWRSLTSGIDDRAEDEGREACANTLTVFEEDLDNAALLGEEEAGTPPLLQGRVVLVGTHLVGLNDRVLSPVHQQIPGVYLHAMALDNLMHWGGRYVRPAGRWQAAGLALVNALLMSLLAGAMLASWAQPGAAMGATGFRGRWLQVGVLLLVLGGAGLLLGGLQQVWLRLPPQDWLGTFAMVFGLSLFVPAKWHRHAAEEEGGDDEPGIGTKECTATGADTGAVEPSAVGDGGIGTGA